MFHTSRTGSSVLGNMLDQHPDLSWRKESFNFNVRNREYLEMDDPVRRLLRDLRDGTWSRYVGIEVVPYQLRRYLDLDLPAFLEILRDLDYRPAILLHRRNLLRKIVSALVARKRERWRFAAHETVPFTTIAIDVERVPRTGPGADTRPLIEILELSERRVAELQRALDDVLELIYEEDVEADPRVGYRKICRHVGLPPHPVEIRDRRANPYPLSRVVENYDVLVAYLRGTRFEWMLEEEPTGGSTRG
ncbi:MAG: hypothetical protein R3199_07930 [Gemmatimonadota bacterium]|nr:hypothetical protein [Gemmatimonadota bacterium]